MEAKAAKRQRKEASSSSKPSSPTVDEGEDDLDALMKHQEQRQQQNGGKRLFNNIIDHSPEKRKILLLSEAEIKQVITLYSEKITTQWRERTLPKLALKAHRIWKKYHLGSTIESMEAELEDLSSRRLFRLHEMLVECNFVSVKSCERMCKALDQTIKWQCELKWMISVCKLDTQPPPVVVSVDGGVTAQPAKQPELKQIELESGIPSLDDGVEDTSSDSDDDEHWSDFIVSDDEEEEWAQVLERARDWTTGRITSPRKQRKVAVEDNNKDILENQPVEDKNIMDDDVLNQDCQDQDDDSANLLDLGASPPPTDSPLQIIPVVKAEKPEDLDKMDLDSPTSRDLSAVVLTGSGTTNDPFMISSSDDEDSGIPLSLRRKASVQPTNSTPSFCSSTIKNRFVLSEDDEDVAVITDDSLVKAVSVASTPITSKKKKTKIFDYFTASLSPPLRISSSVESNSGRLSDKIPRLSSDRALLDMDSELDELLMDIIIRGENKIIRSPGIYIFVKPNRFHKF